jgi:hypothetical protein
VTQRRLSPRTEEKVRGIVFILLALSLPFILVRFMVLYLVAPGYLRRRDDIRQARNAEIRQWQQQQLAALRARTYAQLSALPPESDLPAPPQFAGERFAVIRSAGERGGVDVGVAHFMRFMGVSLSRITPSFEMLSNGEVVEPNYEPDD